MFLKSGLSDQLISNRGLFVEQKHDPSCSLRFYPIFKWNLFKIDSHFLVLIKSGLSAQLISNRGLFVEQKLDPWCSFRFYPLLKWNFHKFDHTLLY